MGHIVVLLCITFIVNSKHLPFLAKLRCLWFQMFKNRTISYLHHRKKSCAFQDSHFFLAIVPGYWTFYSMHWEMEIIFHKCIFFIYLRVFFNCTNNRWLMQWINQCWWTQACIMLMKEFTRWIVGRSPWN